MNKENKKVIRDIYNKYFFTDYVEWTDEGCFAWLENNKQIIAWKNSVNKDFSDAFMYYETLLKSMIEIILENKDLFDVRDAKILKEI